MQLREIGLHVHNKRRELGLTQAQLAKLAGLSRTTVNHLESGALDDLGYAKLTTLLALLGLSLDTHVKPRKSPALNMAAQTASTSYRKVLSPAMLKDILETGDVPDDYKPHMMTLLDETPLPLLIGAMEEASIQSGTPAKAIVRHVAGMASELHAHRMVW